MARIKLVYIGGASTRAPGTMSQFVDRAGVFAGSEIVLVDLDPEHLEVVARLSRNIAVSRGADVTITSTTDRRAALEGADIVLTSFRPGGFEARYLDESIPLKHGVIGQETQGPGGFFMALRAVAVMREIVADVEEICPRATIVNYTNPVNIVSQAVSDNSDVGILSLCDGPLGFPRVVTDLVGLDAELLDTEMVGINHACWTTRHLYAGQDLIPILRDACETLSPAQLESDAGLVMRIVLLADSIPADYLRHYFYRDEMLARLQKRTRTRAQEIMEGVPGYWAHYGDQARAAAPSLDPALSREGIFELELAVHVIDSLVNDRGQVWPVNLRNDGALSGFPDDLIVEVPAHVGRHGASALAGRRLPPLGLGLVEALANYQLLAARAAWSGSRRDAIVALTANPLVWSPAKAEAIFAEMAAAHRSLLPDRLVA